MFRFEKQVPAGVTIHAVKATIPLLKIVRQEGRMASTRMFTSKERGNIYSRQMFIDNVLGFSVINRVQVRKD